jgi:hypothetical protein
LPSKRKNLALKSGNSNLSSEISSFNPETKKKSLTLSSKISSFNPVIRKKKSTLPLGRTDFKPYNQEDEFNHVIRNL